MNCEGSSHMTTEGLSQVCTLLGLLLEPLMTTDDL